jgi:hypothetical protein
MPKGIGCESKVEFVLVERGHGAESEAIPCQKRQTDKHAEAEN